MLDVSVDYPGLLRHLSSAGDASTIRVDAPRPVSILDTADDFDLCDGVWCALSVHRIDVEACDELERIVRLVWDSSGLIGNGGFRRLFECDYLGDPGFVYTVAAYKRIGANAAYEALQAAFRQFPGGVLPAAVHERLRAFESIPEKTWEEIEQRYHEAVKKHSSGSQGSSGSIAAAMSSCLQPAPPPPEGCIAAEGRGAGKTRVRGRFPA